MSLIADMMYSPSSNSEESKIIRDAIGYYFLSRSVSSASGKILEDAIPNRMNKLQEENLMLDVMQKRKKMRLPLTESGLNEGSFPLSTSFNAASVVFDSSKDSLMSSLASAGRKLRYIATGKGPLG